MTPQTFIFLGSSGSGKGTQVEHIHKYLKEHDPGRRIVRLSMGDLFRSFWASEGYTQKNSRAVMEAGELQPSFLQIWLWGNFFINNLNGDEHLLIDGSPRRIEDARAMDSAFRFYRRENVHLVVLTISRAEAKKRLLDRSDNKQNSLRELEDSDVHRMEKRLDWYEEFVVPAIDFLRDSGHYTVIDIDGEQSVQNVKYELISHVFTHDHNE